jgi:hypothetical protein
MLQLTLNIFEHFEVLNEKNDEESLFWLISDKFQIKNYLADF